MSRLTDSRTRVVTWLKIVLPIVALGLLSTMFLLARPTDPDLAIRYSEVDVTELSKEQRVTAPAYAGLTRDGATISITANTVLPRTGEAHTLDAQTVSGRIEFRAGTSADMTAPAAEVDTEGDFARFTGGVSVVTSDGNRFATEITSCRIGNRPKSPPRRRSGSLGPLGTLDAGSMRITQDPAGGYVAVFNGGVRLLYDPMKREE